MPDVPFSLSYDNLVRDVTDELDLVIKKAPTLLSVIMRAAYRAKQHRHEYAEMSLDPEQTTLTTGINTIATTLAVASKAPFTEGAIVRFEGYEEQVRVTSISESQDEITVTRGYGGTTAEEVDSGAKLVIVTKPKRESSRAALKGDGAAPTLNYNFTEIFDDEAVVPKSQGPVYGISQAAQNAESAADQHMNFQVMMALQRIARRMNNALIFGRRVEKTQSMAGTMGGLLQFHGDNNTINAQGERITRKLLGDAFQKAFDGGATQLNTIVCNANQARNISALYESKLRVVREEQTLGQAIWEVQPDMPIEGFVSRIVVEQNFPLTKISVVDRNRIRLVPHRPMQDESSRAPGDDFLARRILGEYTAEFHNISDTAALLSNLDPEVVDPDAGPEPDPE